MNGNLVEELAQIVHVTRALTIGKKIALRLQETLPRQLFEIAIQAKIGAKVLARQNVKAYRKDVTAKLVSRNILGSSKLKLL